MAKIVVIGGGFAGLNFVKHVSNKNDEILLIDKTNHHLFQPLLYQVATAVLSPADIAVPIRDVFRNHKNVKVLMGDVRTIDKVNKKIVLKSKKVFEFDYLVVATGARHSYFGKTDWEQFAGGLKTVKDALKIRENILLSFEKAEREQDPEKRQRFLNFVIVGGGPTGVEMAGSIADIAYKNLVKDFRNFSTKDARVYLIEASNSILPMFDPELSEKARSYLSNFGVIVRTNERVQNITKVHVETQNDIIFTENVIWAAGNEAGKLLQTLNIPLDKQGRAIVNDDCSIPNYKNIFVIGDAAHFTTDSGSLPGIAPVAIQQGKYVAKLLKKKTEKRKPFIYFDKGIMATIGKSKAIAQTGPFKLSGFIAWLAWSFIHLMYLVGYRTKTLVLIEWIISYIFNKKGPRIIYR
ncbi:MAG: NAD(P)/FAD-dependent oxidoreductase [Candidatus Margulisiibacteriota bacterium]